MSDTIILGLLIGLSTALVTAGGAWLVARRKTSGTISTSEAGQLWEEATKIRLDYASRVVDLEGKLGRFELDNRQLEERLTSLLSLNASLKREIVMLREEVFRTTHTDAALERLEVASDKAVHAAEKVATELASSQGRADDTPPGTPGEAADAASKSEPQGRRHGD